MLSVYTVNPGSERIVHKIETYTGTFIYKFPFLFVWKDIHNID